MVRVEEVRESARLLALAAERLPAGLAHAPLPPLPAGGHAVGLVEAWRGPIWHWVVADGLAKLRRVQGRGPVVQELARARLRGAQEHPLKTL